MTLHKEGTATILLSTVFVIIINAGVQFLAPELGWLHNVLIIGSIFLMVMILQFFRKPDRETITDLNLIIAPADGKVVVIEETFEGEYLNEKRKQISIFMSPLNVHINFNPISGIVTYFKYHSGKYLVAWHPKSSTENERTTIVVKHPKGTEILFRQIAGAMARRICWYVDKGQTVKQGAEFGFIKFGSRVDIYVPIDAEVLVNIDDETIGGQTPIVRLA
ncbi:MAG: phosphatidylserine decarboxylase [Spirosomataceae bacterium]|jgi:phosphatidylserine decarboxylase